MLDRLRPRARAALCAAIAAAIATASGAARALDTALYSELLGRYTVESGDVAGTRVDYRGLSREPRWRALVESLARAKTPDAAAAREARLAFWINAYNILAIDVVLESYPVASIRDAGSFWRPVWDREAGRVGGRAVSLGEIEHQILRPLGEPRIHAAIVCASTSCPSLARTPFEAAQLDAQLTTAMRRFLASPDKGLRIDRTAGRITLSRIFEWFEEDFASQGGVVRAITPYAPEADRAWLERSGPAAALRYFDYDWSLNDSAATTPKG